MSGDDTFCSSSDSSEQPFHSTPVKNQVQYVSNKILLSRDNSEDDVSEESRETRQGFSSAIGVTASTSNSSHNTAASDRSFSDAENTDIWRPTNTSSAWEHWLLKKEEQRRKQLHIQLELKQKQLEEEKRTMQVKMLQKKIAEERYQKWLHTKKFELKKLQENERLSRAKKELDDKLETEKVMRMTQQQLQKWKEKKLREEKTRAQSEVQQNAKPIKEVEEHKQKCESAFKKWLKNHQFKRDPYSYGYAGGIIVSYYDRTSCPPPNYFNPKPWI